MTTDDVKKIVRGETKPRFDSIDNRFTSIDNRFDSIDDRFTSIDNRFASIEKKIDNVLNFMNTIMKRFADWEEERVLFRGQRDSIEDLDIRLEKLEKTHQNSGHLVSAS